MTGPTTSAPIKNAVVRRLRATDLKTALKGGFHQSLASRRTAYPFLTYQEISAPSADDWGSDVDGGVRTIFWLGDVVIWSVNPVQAENLLQLVVNALSNRYADKELQQYMVGQKVTRCVATAMTPASGSARDEEGRRVFSRGVTISIETVQSIPKGSPPAP
jgi:hypothetical protein